MTIRGRKVDPGLVDRSERSFCCQRSLELAACVDAEFAEDVLEVTFDRLPGDEQRLGDLSVGHPLDRKIRDASLRGRQGVSAGDAVTARSRAGSAQLVLCTLSEGAGSAGPRQV